MHLSHFELFEDQEGVSVKEEEVELKKMEAETDIRLYKPVQISSGPASVGT